MNFRQRKAHKYIWLLLVILIPVVMLFSIKDLNIFNTHSKEVLEMKSIKKDALKTSENNFIKVSLYANTLELIVKVPFKSASALVYKLDKKTDKRKLLGQVSTVGIYTFNFANSIDGIVIVDALKETEITKITF